MPSLPAAAARPGVRFPEIHGLRGLALVLVVLFHLFGAGRISGGVDVFLVVSGFLVTRSLVRRADVGSLRISAAWARNAARLAPSALVVLATVAVGAWLLLPQSSWASIWRQIVASAFSLENWDLIANELSYGAAGPEASPLQHFWSLSVQGQFLLFWPLVVLLVAVAVRRSRTGVGPVLLPLVALATAASLAYAVYLTDALQPVAYFHTGTRFWELGAGALLALVPLGVPGRVRALGAWLGLILVVASGFVLDGGDLFPGPWTLWPVAGALLVIAGAGTPSSWGPRGMLAVRPLRFLADISYELYLWHWPVLIFFMALTGVTSVGWPGATVVLTTSVLLAWVTRRLVARPVARVVPPTLPPLRALTALSAVAVATALVVVPVLNLQSGLERRTTAAAAQFGTVDDAHPGAAAVGAPGVVPQGALRPALEAAQEDKGAYFSDDACVQNHGSGPGYERVRWCDLTSPERPTATVLAAGGSHVYQWAEPLQQIARENGWRLVLAGKGRCRVMHVPDPRFDCVRWSDNVIELAKDLRPDAMIVDGTHTRQGGEPEYVSENQIAAWQVLDDAGIALIGLRDNPRGGVDPLVPDCLAELGVSSKQCDLDRSQVYREVSPALTTPGVPESMVHIDLTDWYCQDERCPAVLGNVLVYRDASHLSNTFMLSMRPMLADALRARAPWLYTAAPVRQART